LVKITSKEEEGKRVVVVLGETGASDERGGLHLFLKDRMKSKPLLAGVGKKYR